MTPDGDTIVHKDYLHTVHLLLGVCIGTNIRYKNNINTKFKLVKFWTNYIIMIIVYKTLKYNTVS